MYPSIIFRVSVSLSKSEAIRATVTRVPCKVNKATVSTANNRRYKLEKMGKIEMIAESYGYTMLSAVTMDEVEISSLVFAMQDKLSNQLKQQQEILAAMLMNASTDTIEITVKDWEA